MVQASIKQGEIEVGKVLIPTDHNEIKYGQYLDYVFVYEELLNWVSTQQELGIDYQYQYLAKLGKAVSIIYNIDYEVLLNINFGENKWFESAWSRIELFVNDYKPCESSSFTIGKNKYSIPLITKAIFRGTNNLPDLTLQQVTEIAECERILSMQLKAIDKEEKEFPENGLQKAQAFFNQTLKKFALIVTPHKEIPVDNTFSLWVEKKARELKDISFPDALNLIFFLTDTESDYYKLIALSSTFNLLRSESTDTKTENSTAIELVK